MDEALTAFAHLARPFACIDLEALDWNIKMVNVQSKGKDIRIATKSIRSVELLQYIAERLDNHSGWMTFDCQETLFLLERGFTHILLGYPQMERESIELMIPYIAQGADITFMIDREEHWRLLHEIGLQHNIVLKVCIDVNVSTDFKWIYFGTQRSSLKQVEDVKSLLMKMKEFPNTEVIGIMGYEAQIAGVVDRPVIRWQQPLIQFLKKRSMTLIGQLRRDTVNQIKKACPSIQFVNGGGSGSIDFTVQAKEVTELTIGSAFYFPALFSRYKQLPFKSAASYALRVTRIPEDGIAVCHGGGYTASGAIGIDKAPVPFWPNNLYLLKNEGPGEVQTPLLDKDRILSVGDTVFFRHAKAGELCERFLKIHGRRGDKYVKAFKTYRGEGGCFI